MIGLAAIWKQCDPNFALSWRKWIQVVVCPHCPTTMPSVFHAQARSYCKRYWMSFLASLLLSSDFTHVTARKQKKLDVTDVTDV